MAKGLEVCHKIDFTHTHTHILLFHFLFHFCLLSALGFVAFPVKFSVFWDFWCWALGAFQEGQENEEGELSLVWESSWNARGGMRSQQRAQERREDRERRCFSGKIKRVRASTHRSSLRLEFADLQALLLTGGLNHPDPYGRDHSAGWEQPRRLLEWVGDKFLLK